MPSEVGQHASAAPLVRVHGAGLADCAAQHAAVGGPYTVGGSVDLVDGTGMPDEHVAGHGAELQELVLVVLEALLLDVDKDGPLVDDVVAVRSLEVDGRAVLGGSFVHGNPEADSVLPRDGAVLVVLVPLEALVGVDHEKVGGDADLVGPAALAQDVAHGGVVVEVGEGLVGLPYVALDVVIELGGRPGEGPEVGVVDLVAGGVAQVLDPLGVEHALDVNDSVLLEGLDLLFGQLVGLWGGLAGDDAMGHCEAGILQTEVVLPKGWLLEDLFPLGRSHVRGRRRWRCLLCGSRRR